MKYKEYNAFEMLVGGEIEDKVKHFYERDRYGAQERKRAEEENEKNIRREEEMRIVKLDRKKMIYNNWVDLTKTTFWKKYVQTDVEYYGINTKFIK
tara:strand:+ start:347 stop:634 length:288 start_codon:yes stop_codon:yes gene_type:complete